MSTRVEKAQEIVFQYVQGYLEGIESDINLLHDDIYVVWFAYILGGWKALAATTLPDNRYFEITHNATNGETYLDVYEKVENIVIPSEEESG